MNQSDIQLETPALTPRELRDVFGCFVTGVTVVTILDSEGCPHGITANSFSSVSLEPPLVLWSQALSAPSHPLFRAARHLVINMLAEDQVDISTRFSRPNADRFSSLDTRPGIGGAPMIQGCIAHVECTIDTIYPGGDHAIFLCGVQRVGRLDGRSLGFSCGKYVSTHPHQVIRQLPVQMDAQVLEGAR